MTDEPRRPASIVRFRADRERAMAVGRQLVGLTVHDATTLARRSGCRLRVVRQDGRGLVVTAELVAKRIDVDVDGEIVVAAFGEM